MWILLKNTGFVYNVKMWILLKNTGFVCNVKMWILLKNTGFVYNVTCMFVSWSTHSTPRMQEASPKCYKCKRYRGLDFSVSL